MIYTTNFDNLWRLPKECKIVAITLGKPPVVDGYDIIWDITLAPQSWKLVRLGKYGNKKDRELYRSIYIEETLNRLDLREVYNKYGDNTAYVCFCKRSEFCHRHILADEFSTRLCIDIIEP